VKPSTQLVAFNSDVKRQIEESTYTFLPKYRVPFKIIVSDLSSGSLRRLLGRSIICASVISRGSVGGGCGSANKPAPFNANSTARILSDSFSRCSIPTRMRSEPVPDQISRLVIDVMASAASCGHKDGGNSELLPSNNVRKSNLTRFLRVSRTSSARLVTGRLIHRFRCYYATVVICSKLGSLCSRTRSSRSKALLEIRKMAQEQPTSVESADSEGSRPRIRDDVARQSDLMSLGVPR
jgi:hypothetical protein